MSAHKETAIWLAIKSRIDTLPSGYARAWPGKTFVPPQAGSPPTPAAYYRIGQVTSAPRRMLIDDGKPHNRDGFIIVTLVYPLGQDVAVYTQAAGIIASHFKDGTRMRYGALCVSVPEYPHVGDGFADAGYWMVPVRIPWGCYV